MLAETCRDVANARRQNSLAVCHSQVSPPQKSDMSSEGVTRIERAPSEVVDFGPFRLSPAARLLERDGAPLELGARALDVLIALVEQAGQTVSKTDLMSSIWAGLTVVEGVLRTHVYNLRKSLGGRASAARYITSVAGRGYCFVAPVVRRRAGPEPCADLSSERDPRGNQDRGELIAFGPFRLFPAARLLERDGRAIPVGNRALDLLIELVKRPGSVVSRGELLDTIWYDATVVEGVLRTHVHHLRRALGDGVGGARYVTSVAGRGYCFVAPVARRPMEFTTHSASGEVWKFGEAAHKIAAELVERQ